MVATRQTGSAKSAKPVSAGAALQIGNGKPDALEMSRASSAPS